MAHNGEIDERDKWERQQAYEKLRKMPGGPLHKDAKGVKIIETVVETEEGFPQPDLSPLPSSSKTPSSSSRTPPPSQELECEWRTEESSGEKTEAKKGKGKSRSSRQRESIEEDGKGSDHGSSVLLQSSRGDFLSSPSTEGGEGE